MTKRLDYKKATDAKRMNEQGTERIEGPDTAAEAQSQFRAGMNGRSEDRQFQFKKASHASHKRILAQANADYVARRRMPGQLIKSGELSERLAGTKKPKP